jgi:Flp pilus assembly pilin Flp
MGLGQNLLRYLKSQDGASAAEYALLLGTVAAALGLTLFALGAAVSSRFNSASAAMDGHDAAALSSGPGGSANEGPGGTPGVPTPGGNGNGHAFGPGGNNAGGNGNGNGFGIGRGGGRGP